MVWPRTAVMQMGECLGKGLQLKLVKQHIKEYIYIYIYIYQSLHKLPNVTVMLRNKAYAIYIYIYVICVCRKRGRLTCSSNKKRT
jgi:hypothetical protein